MLTLGAAITGLFLGAGTIYLYFRDSHMDLRNLRADYESERGQRISMQEQAERYRQQALFLIGKQRHDLRDASGKFAKRG